MECITPQAPGTLWQSASLTKLSLMENSDRHSEEGNPPGESQTYFYSPPPEALFLHQHRNLLLEVDYKWMSKGQRESRESKLRKKAYLNGMGIKPAASTQSKHFTPSCTFCTFVAVWEQSS